MSIHCISRVWTHSAQEGNALLLLLALADYADENGFAFPGQKALAAKTRLCVRQTRRLLAALQAAGELLVLDRPGRGSLYVVLPGASRQALAAALDRAAAFGARLSSGALQAPLGRPATTPDILPPTPDRAMSAPPSTTSDISSPTPDIAMSAPPHTGMSPTPDIAMSAPPFPTPDISSPTPDIAMSAPPFPTPDILAPTPDIAMSADPSVTLRDPSEDPSGESEWQTMLDALSSQMDPATFNQWLRGSRALGLRDGCLTVQVRHANALPWLEQRLARTIHRTLARYLPGVRLRFLAPGDPSHPLALDHNPTPGDPSHPPPLALAHNPTPDDPSYPLALDHNPTPGLALAHHPPPGDPSHPPPLALDHNPPPDDPSHPPPLALDHNPPPGDPSHPPPLALDHNPPPPSSSGVGCDNRFAKKLWFAPHPLHYPPPYANDWTAREPGRSDWLYDRAVHAEHHPMRLGEPRGSDERRSGHDRRCTATMALRKTPLTAGTFRATIRPPSPAQRTNNRAIETGCTIDWLCVMERQRKGTR